MAVFALTDVDLWVEEFAAEGFVRSVNVNVEVDALDKTTFADSGWRRNHGGLKNWTLEVEAFQDFAVNTGFDGRIAGLSELGVSTVVSVTPTTAAAGGAAYFMRGIPLTYPPITGAVGDMASTSFMLAGTDPAVRGVVLEPAASARTSTFNTTGQQIGSVAAGKSVYSSLHVFSVSGSSTPTATVIIQSDDNAGFTSPTSRITFTAATAVGAQFSSAAGAITDDYWRANVTISGTSPSFLLGITVGII